MRSLWFLRAERIAIPVVMLLMVWTLGHIDGEHRTIADVRPDNETIQAFSKALDRQQETNRQIKEALNNVATAMTLIHEGNKATQSMMKEMLNELKERKGQP